ncbi:serine hydrolase [Sphaerisporangium sp. TRM90804]|uniref:serine hydrolase n=1 Tax=Sphaerisporangium sp. TRM90804 TaxID=3031113 RepID=UPI00244925FC|nr:serine hydrolase [Sphaerisporangium sp. TRM90804]MDH2425842.1 serine hydrolase [Sphaerisporangium sp. TRM90804]
MVTGFRGKWRSVAYTGAIVLAATLPGAVPAHALTAPAEGVRSLPPQPSPATPAASGAFATFPAPLPFPPVTPAAGRTASELLAAPPTVSARTAYLVDVSPDRARRVLYSKRASARVPVASLNKVMTAYVVLREAELSDTVRVSAADVRHAASKNATHASLRAGERLTVKELLYALMLPSGADASHALAGRYGPGEKRFVAKMNAAARELGLTNTRYTTSDGLTSGAAGWSTAADQVRLARIALADPALRAIAGAERRMVARTAAHRAHVWLNSNELIGTVPGVIGVKTGYTRAAGACLLFATERGGRLLIGAVLGDTTRARRFVTARRLLTWAGGAV